MKLRVLDKVRTEIIDGNEMIFIPKFYYRTYNTASDNAYYPKDQPGSQVGGTSTAFDICLDERPGYSVYPAFVNCKNGFWISTHKISQNEDGVPQSKAGAEPWVNVSYNDATKAAEFFGVGYHLPTFFQYEALMLLGFLNNGGKALFPIANRIKFDWTPTKDDSDYYADKPWTRSECLFKAEDYPTNFAIYAAEDTFWEEKIPKKEDYKFKEFLLEVDDFGTGPLEWVKDAIRANKAPYVRFDNTNNIFSSLGMNYTGLGSNGNTYVLTTSIGANRSYFESGVSYANVPGIYPKEIGSSNTLSSFTLGFATPFANKDKYGKGNFKYNVLADPEQVNNETVTSRVLVGGAVPDTVRMDWGSGANYKYYYSARKDPSTFFHSPYNITSIRGYDNDAYAFVGFRVAKED